MVEHCWTCISVCILQDHFLVVSNVHTDTHMHTQSHIYIYIMCAYTYIHTYIHIYIYIILCNVYLFILCSTWDNDLNWPFDYCWFMLELSRTIIQKSDIFWCFIPYKPFMAILGMAYYYCLTPTKHWDKSSHPHLPGDGHGSWCLPSGRTPNEFHHQPSIMCRPRGIPIFLDEIEPQKTSLNITSPPLLGLSWNEG